MLRFFFAISAIGLMSACNPPRGGANQSEISTEASKTDAPLSIYQVDRASLPKYQKWSSPDAAKNNGWLRHKHQGSENAISAGDLLNVVIWDSEESSLFTGRGQSTKMSGLKVSDGGTVFLPFVGVVQVAGLSENAARTRIQRKLVEVAPSAQIQLTVTKGPRGSVSVVSGVNRPGPYPVEDGHFTILSAVAAAGGATGTVNNPQLRLIRKGKTYVQSLNKVLENPDLDTILRGGDKISIEPDQRYFRSLGAATKEAIIPFDRAKISALDAMSMIGGLDARSADPKGIMILRQYKPSQVREDGTGPSNDRAVFVFDLTSADGMFSAGEFNIQSKDTVLVSESSLVSTNYALGVLLRLTGAAEDLNALR